MKTGHTLLTVAAVVLLGAGLSLGDSCPYCGREYGNAGPGDEARVQALRRYHEAHCPYNPDNQRQRPEPREPRTGGTNGGGDGGPTWQPDPGIVAYNQGVDLYNAGNYAAAEPYFRKAAALLDWPDSDGWRMLGNCLLGQKKWQEALAAFRRAVEINWFDSAARRQIDRIQSFVDTNEGSELFNAGHHREGLARFRSAVRLDPDNDVARENLKLAETAVKRDDATEKIAASLSSAAAALGKPAPASRGLDFKSLDASLYRPPVRRGVTGDRPLTYALDEKSAQRGRHIRAMSDAQLDRRIGRTQELLARMGADFSRADSELKAWLEESQDAQRDAILTGAETALGAMPEAMLARMDRLDPITADRAMKVREAILKAQGDLAKIAWDVATGPADREARIKSARDALQAAYGFLSELHETDELLQHGPAALKLATFLTDYSYEAMRWNVARMQMGRIIDAMDRPGGQLDAQRALKRLHEELIAERNRRKSEPAWAQPRTGEGRP